MAELTAVVDVRDKASSKFQTMKESARRFEMQLNDVSRELDVINAKLVALTSRRWTIHLDTDRGMGGLGGSRVVGPNGLMAPDPGAVNANGDPYGGRITPAQAARRTLPEGDERRRNNIAGIGSGGTGRFFMRRLIMPLMAFAFRGGAMLGEALGFGLMKAFTGLARDQLESVPKWIKMMGKVGGGFAGIAVAAAIAIPIVAALTIGLGVLGNIIFSLAVPIAAIIPLLTAVGASLAFAVVPMFMWISKTKQLVDQKKQLREQLSRLTPGTAEYAAKLKELNEVQDDLDKNGGEYIYTKAMELWEKAKEMIFSPKNTQMFVDTLDSILRALEPLIPIVSDLIYKFTGVFKGLFDELGGWISSSDGESWFARVFGPDMVKLVGTLGKGIGLLVELFGELSAAIAPVANVLFEKLNNWMEGLSGRLKSGESDLGGWLMSMMNTFTLLASVVGSAIKHVANFLADPVVQSYTQKFLNWFKEMVPKAMSFMKGVFVKYGPIVILILKILGNAIRIIWNSLENVFAVFVPLAEVTYEIINNILSWVAKMQEKGRPVFEWLGTALKFLVVEPLKLTLGLLIKIIEKWEGFKNSWAGKLIGTVAGPILGGWGSDEDPEIKRDPETEALLTLPDSVTAYGSWNSGTNRHEKITVQNMHVHNPGSDTAMAAAIKQYTQNKSSMDP